MKTLNIIRGLIAKAQVQGEVGSALIESESTKFYLYAYLHKEENELHVEVAQREGNTYIPLEITPEDKTVVKLHLEKFIKEDQTEDHYPSIDPFKLYAVSQESFINLN